MGYFNIYGQYVVDDHELYHHGILGMKWGERNGPPYPLRSGDHSSREKKAGWRKSLSGNGGNATSASKKSLFGNSKHASSGSKKSQSIESTKPKSKANSEADNSKTDVSIKYKRAIKRGAVIAASALAIYGGYKVGSEVAKGMDARGFTVASKNLSTDFSDSYKRHSDQYIDAGTEMVTLSYDKDRTKNTDMFFAAYKGMDKAKYASLFNKKTIQKTYDADHVITDISGQYKFRISNKLIKRVKVASEDSGISAFADLLKKDKDFKDFVMDPSKMEAHFDRSKLRFKGYREAMNSLKKLRSSSSGDESKDIANVYRMFNFVIPSSKANGVSSDQMVKYRGILFKELKKRGYGAVLDTNDGLYGRYKASAPVIFFDMSAIGSTDIRQTDITDKVIADLSNAGYMAIQQFLKDKYAA